MSRQQRKESQPLHIENTVLVMGKQDLNINNAFNTYREMKLDGVVSGSVSFIKSLLNKGDFKVECNEATKEQQKLIDAINYSLNNLKGYTKPRILNQWLSIIDYGASINEVVLKRDGGYMVFDEISPIHLTTVERFEMKNNTLMKLHLATPENDGLLVQESGGGVVDGKKLLFFRLESDSDFPLGKSLLYGAYSSWRAKKILQEYEAIGVAKSLSGVLQLKMPAAYINKYFAEPNSDEAIHVQSVLDQAQNLHAGKGSYILLPSDTTDNGVDLFRASTISAEGNSNSNVGESISRYNVEILLSLQSMVLALGSSGGGSFALSDNSTHLLSLFVDSIQTTLGGELLQMVKSLFAINGVEAPKCLHIAWEEVQPLTWDDFTRGWSRLLQAGGVSKTEDLEHFLRKEGGAPKADYDKLINTESNYTEERRETDRQA